MSDWADEKAHALMWKLFPGGFAFRDEAKKDVAETLRKARADALEEAARVVAAMPRTYDKVREDVDVLGLGKGMWTLTLNNGPKECAAAIRALKEGK